MSSPPPTSSLSETRRAILEREFPGVSLLPQEWTQVLEATKGFSGADLKHMAMQAAFLPIRELHTARFWEFTKGGTLYSVFIRQGKHRSP